MPDQVSSFFLQLVQSSYKYIIVCPARLTNTWASSHIWPASNPQGLAGLQGADVVTSIDEHGLTR